MSNHWSNRRVPGSSRTPAFQPPSFYAAAGGFQYNPTPDRSPHPGRDTRTTNNTQHPSYPDDDAHSNRATRREDSRKPADTRDERSTSSNSSGSRRSNSLSRSFLPGSHGHREDKERPKYEVDQKQIVDIPFMETSLLPSLRDTIDKMTHPPRTGTQEYLDIPQPPEPSTSRSSPRSTTNTRGAPPLGLQPQDSALSPSFSPAYRPSPSAKIRAELAAASGSSGLRTPQISVPKGISSQDRRETPAVSGVKTPRSALKPPRTPQFTSPVPSQLPVSPATPGKSLRSVKSILSSAQSTLHHLSPNLASTSQLRSPNIKSPHAPVEGPQPLRPDPTTTPRLKSKSSSQAATPIISQGISPRTGIPRARHIGDSGSELEREYGRSFAPGKLVVANATIEPSSSDSSRAVEQYDIQPIGSSHLRVPRNLRPGPSPERSHAPVSPRAGPSRQAMPQGYHTSPFRDDPGARGAVGLGLDLYPEQRMREYRPNPEEDDQSIYDETDIEHVAHPANSRTREFSGPQKPLVEYADDESVYDDDDDQYSDAPNQTRTSFHAHIANTSRTSVDRRQALVGLIDNLQTTYNIQPESSRMSYSESEANYRVQGLAISSSRELEDEPDQHEYSRHEQRAQGYDEYYPERPRRRRSSSRTLHADTESTEAVVGASVTQATPSRRTSTRGSRSSSVPPHASRSVSRQETKPSREEVPSRPQHASSEGKARHRLSQSAGRLTERPRDPRNQDPPDRTPRPPRPQRSGSNKESERHKAEHRTSDLILREREGFGIPASLSYGGVASSPEGDPDNGDPRDAFIRSDSGNSLSSVEELCRVGRTLTTAEGEGESWRAPHGGLSTGAQALFRNLSTGSQHSGRGANGRREPRRTSSGNGTKSPKSMKRRSSSVPQPSEASMRHDRPPSPVHAQSQQPLSQEQRERTERPKSREASKRGDARNSSSSWKSTLHPSSYKALHSKHGSLEMQRQELVYEQYLYQREFVVRLRSIVRMFIQPLKHKHSKAWIPGVPPLAGRLFDWLEDIVNLHAGIYDALENASHAWGGGIVIHAAQAIRGFVPKLEIYQPYLARVGEVKSLLTNQNTNGQYEEFLEFVSLRERHPECGGWTLANLLQQPVERLLGFVPVFEHLLAVTPAEHPDHVAAFSLCFSTRMIVQVLLEVKAREEEYDMVKDISTRIEGLLPSVRLAKRERRLLWDGEVTLMPMPGKRAAESRSRDEPSAQYPEFRGRLSTGYGHLLDGRDAIPSVVLSPYHDSHDQQGGGVREDGRYRRHDAKAALEQEETTLHSFVFTDILVLAIPISEPRAETAHWRLFSRLGISRIIGVTDGECLSLNLLPLSPSDLQAGTIPEGSDVATIRISLPHNSVSLSEARKAFVRCHAYTLRSLSFPSHTGAYLPHGPHVDLEGDTQQSVVAILNTGLPLPKSPSVQGEHMERLRTMGKMSDSDQEREERGWWALRFQQVLKEMQRQDAMVALETVASGLC